MPPNDLAGDLRVATLAVLPTLARGREQPLNRRFQGSALAWREQQRSA
jgi:hypothetical protein